MLKKVLPIFLRLFDRLMQLGHFVGGKNIFLFSDAGCRRLWGHVPEHSPRVLFGHAGDPDSLKSATIKAGWLDKRVGMHQIIRRSGPRRLGSSGKGKTEAEQK